MASLQEIRAALGDGVTIVGGEAEIADVTHDSRAVGPGVLFVAIRGGSADGHDFISQAVAGGAAAVMVEEAGEVGIPQIVVSDTRRSMAWAARAVHGRPDEDLTLLGVTGTNGKTTVVHMCEAVWRASGVDAGVIGTLGARIGGVPAPLARTTPEATDLQRLLASVRDAGIDVVAMEVSSHALDLHRVDAIRFAAVGFTNLSQDHLDFHGDMERYYWSKAQLFTRARARHAVVDIGSRFGLRLARDSEIPVLTACAHGEADVMARDVSATTNGTSFTIETRDGSARVDLPLLGGFNVSNALVATGLLLIEGRTIDAIATGLGRLDPVPGRMEVVAHDGPFTVVVDYAHTPDAISTVLGSVRRAAEARVISLVGAGGDRDRDKRELMGAAASRFSDVTIVTTDNPRSEDPSAIAAAVRRGADTNPAGTVMTILDRREAIAAAVREAAAGDVVLILGRGHETGQEVAGEVRPFDDRQAAKDALREEGWQA